MLLGILVDFDRILLTQDCFLTSLELKFNLLKFFGKCNFDVWRIYILCFARASSFQRVALKWCVLELRTVLKSSNSSNRQIMLCYRYLFTWRITRSQCYTVRQHCLDVMFYCCAQYSCDLMKIDCTLIIIWFQENLSTNYCAS